MTGLTRRGLLEAGGSAALAAGISGEAKAVSVGAPGSAPERFPWRRGLDGQRIADLGDGTFLNPILAGDHPDPAILKDGADYYMTFSSFDSIRGC
jgi:hypothetical protein